MRKDEAPDTLHDRAMMRGDSSIHSPERVTLEILSVPCGEEWKGLTYPVYRPLLEQAAPKTRLNVLAASRGQLPVGLCIADAARTTAVVRSLFVVEGYRRRGIGTALISRIEDELRQQGWSVVKIYYTTGRPEVEGFEAFLLRHGWSGPQVRQLLIRSDAEHLHRMPWFKPFRLPAGFEILPWKDLRPEDRHTLQLEAETGDWIPHDLNPFKYELDRHEETSVALRRNGKVVGWLINHLLPGSIVRLTSGWVHPDIQRRGLMIQLWVHSLQRVLDCGLSEASWGIPLEHDSMARFARRWLVPWATEVRESRLLSKMLTPEGSQAISRATE